MVLRGWTLGAGVLASMAAASCVLQTNGLGTGGAPTTASSSSTSSSGGAATSSSHASSSGTGGDVLTNTTCADGVKNGLETDVDCGGDSCPPCALGSRCNGGADCGSGTCTGGLCTSTSTTCAPVVAGAPTCGDCVKDGLETDVDCGGDACPPCALGRACVAGADCATGTCTGGVCVATVTVCEPVDPSNPSCGDCVKDGLETDVDCGGDACPPCGLGHACAIGADCATRICQAGTCAAGSATCAPVDPANPSCGDCVKDGLETDVDCGGDACLPCVEGKGCVNDADCLSGSCASGTCRAGGKGSACMGVTDCQSKMCASGGCWTGFCCH